ncbi:MAG: DnaJ C-terminal domain-containing protein [Planctomycetota bacterium]|nr:DnaJ C-terminal domain-containing protein [Planctomycetota bacterium]
MAERDYYDVLSVARNATDAQVKAAYRKLARKYHPDVNKAPDAAAKFREATEAYEVLSDPEKRKVYDQFGHAGLAGKFGGAAGGEPVYTWRPGPAGGGGAYTVDFGDMFGGRGGFTGMSLDDLLAALGGAGPARRRRPQRGADLEHHVTLDFTQAAKGATTSIRIRQPGGGKAETIDVKIPPGIREGSKVRVRGKGAVGPGANGDLYIIIHVRPHPYFRRDGNDVYVDLPISITEAALGAKVQTPTIDGMTTVTIPPGTDGGKRLRLKNKGVPAADGKSRGDQYIVIRVVVPHEVSARGKELLKELESIQKYDPRSNAPWK